MTNLSDKFAEVLAYFQQSLTYQQQILTALGVPPETPTVTLADVLTAINATNAKLDTLLLTSGNMLANTNVINTHVAELTDLYNQWYVDYFSGDGTKQLLENISYGTMDVRAAILATACACNTEGPILPTPPDVTPFPTEEEQLKCKRAQRFVDWFETDVLDLLRDTYSAGGFIGLAAMGVILEGAMVALLPETAGIALIPAVAIGSLVALFSNIGSNTADGLVENYAIPARKAILMQAIFNGSNADEAKHNVDLAIDQMVDVPQPYREIWKAAAMQVFFNQTFDPAANINVDGYSGTICGGGSVVTCHNHISVQNMFGELIVYWDNAIIPMRNFFGLNNHNSYFGPEVAGWTIINDRSEIAYFAAWIDPNTLIINTQIPALGSQVIPSEIQRGYVSIPSNADLGNIKLCEPEPS